MGGEVAERANGAVNGAFKIKGTVEDIGGDDSEEEEDDEQAKRENKETLKQKETGTKLPRLPGCRHSLPTRRLLQPPAAAVAAAALSPPPPCAAARSTGPSGLKQTPAPAACGRAGRRRAAPRPCSPVARKHKAHPRAQAPGTPRPRAATH
ncbi:hypothetical protein NL676_025431 [Syzygium grande]|nr:hypothetical protein NL676_025431 [Syzygium grande]